MQAAVELSTQEVLSGLMDVEVSESLLEEAVELYAEHEIPDERARDEFIQEYSEENYQAIVRKAVVEVIVAVLAAHTIDSEDIFRGVIKELDLPEEDDVIGRMKLTMFDKMSSDAVADMDDEHITRFTPRVAYVKTLLV